MSVYEKLIYRILSLDLYIFRLGLGPTFFASSIVSFITVVVIIPIVFLKIGVFDTLFPELSSFVRVKAFAYGVLLVNIAGVAVSYYLAQMTFRKRQNEMERSLCERQEKLHTLELRNIKSHSKIDRENMSDYA